MSPFALTYKFPFLQFSATGFDLFLFIVSTNISISSFALTNKFSFLIFSATGFDSFLFIVSTNISMSYFVFSYKLSSLFCTPPRLLLIVSTIESMQKKSPFSVLISVVLIGVVCKNSC